MFKLVALSIVLLAATAYASLEQSETKGTEKRHQYDLQFGDIKAKLDAQKALKQKLRKKAAPAPQPDPVEVAPAPANLAEPPKLDDGEVEVDHEESEVTTDDTKIVTGENENTKKRRVKSRLNKRDKWSQKKNSGNENLKVNKSGFEKSKNFSNEQTEFTSDTQHDVDTEEDERDVFSMMHYNKVLENKKNTAHRLRKGKGKTQTYKHASNSRSEKEAAKVI